MYLYQFTHSTDGHTERHLFSNLKQLARFTGINYNALTERFSRQKMTQYFQYGNDHQRAIFKLDPIKGSDVDDMICRSLELIGDMYHDDELQAMSPEELVWRANDVTITS